VLAYAVTTGQSSQVYALLVHHYDSHSAKIQRGLVHLLMVMGKVTGSTQEFTVEEIERATCVVDPG